MPIFGSGIGIPVTNPPLEIDYSLYPVSTCAISLAEYAAIIGYDECAFFGVYYDGQIDYDCRMFWTEWQRLNIYRALQESQLLIESVTGYTLCPTWIVGSSDSEQHYIDTQPYNHTVLLKFANLIAQGVRATTGASASLPVDYTTEPAIIGPIAMTVTNVDEVKIYYPGTYREITPLKVTYSGGDVMIYVPRCRLTILPNTTDDGVDYNVLDNFLETVDVIRIYNDSSVNSSIVDHSLCSVGCGTETLQSVCLYPVDKRLGIVNIKPVTGSCNTHCGILRLNYLAGLSNPSMLIKTAIIRLAHARMAEAPCHCSNVQNIWAMDRNSPAVTSRERLNCPFGLQDGAWNAYKVAQSLKIRRMSVW